MTTMTKMRLFFALCIAGLVGLTGYALYTLKPGFLFPSPPPHRHRVFTKKGRSKSSLLRAEEEPLHAWTFMEKPLVIWSNDFHIGPIQDLKELLQPLGVKFIDNSLSGACSRTNTCARNLRVINQQNGINLDPKLIPKFYKAYSKDPEMASVDAFVCFHPSAMCELFMPFNKSIIVIASTRYEMGRLSYDRWEKWNQNLLTISQDPKNVVAANNLYDAKYIEYFTGIKTEVLLSYCGYIPQSYAPKRPGFLLAEIHKNGFEKVFMDLYKTSCRNITGKCLEIYPLRQKYKHYEYSDLVAHQGIVYIPYQVSVMSLFEQYRMNIPLFFPSVNLLTEWQFKYQVMNERTWAGVSNIRSSKSTIEPHPSQKHLPDPNCETDRDAIKYWIQFSDFYNMPHIILYDSVDDLLNKLTTTDLNKTSSDMKTYNAQFKEDLLKKWRSILSNIALFSSNNPY